MKHFLLSALILIGQNAAADDPVAAWSKDVKITPVSSVSGRHSIHSYYVANPESPDGKRIYYNTSDGEFTRLMVAERP